MATLEGKARFRIDTETTGASIAIMIATTVVFASSDSTIKLICTTVPLLALLWVRYVFQTVTLGVWRARSNARGLFRTRNVKL